MSRGGGMSRSGWFLEDMSVSPEVGDMSVSILAIMIQCKRTFDECGSIYGIMIRLFGGNMVPPDSNWRPS